jgi:hypothetical protein
MDDYNILRAQAGRRAKKIPERFAFGELLYLFSCGDEGGSRFSCASVSGKNHASPASIPSKTTRIVIACFGKGKALRVASRGFQCFTFGIAYCKVNSVRTRLPAKP